MSSAARCEGKLGRVSVCMCWADGSGEELFLPPAWHSLPWALPSLLHLPCLLSVMPAPASIECAVKWLMAPSSIVSWIFLGAEC